MNVQTKSEKRLLCPSCGKTGKRVSPVTVRALLKDQYGVAIAASDPSRCGTNATGEPGCKPASGDAGWRFCDSRACDVAYFGEEGEGAFTRSQLKVAVGVKESEGERPLCYCFGHSVASIKEALRAKGRSDALEDIRAKMKDPGCFCEKSNPSGSCCLGSVAKGIQIAQEELKMNDSNVTPAKSAGFLTGRGETIANIGTIVSAIMASACCWLPLMLLAVGVSGAGISGTLEAYRPLFIVVTVGFLGAAFYLTYRKKSAAAADCCAPAATAGENCCPPTGTSRFSMMTLNKVMLWVVTVLAVAFLFFPSYVGLLFGTRDQAVVTDNATRAVFQIEGMTCEGCSTTVAQAIRKVPGVLAVEVSYKKRRAIVSAEACCPVPEAEILAALKNVGYSGTLLEPHDRAKGGSEGSR